MKMDIENLISCFWKDKFRITAYFNINKRKIK